MVMQEYYNTFKTGLNPQTPGDAKMDDLIEKISAGSIHISLAYAEVDNGYDYLNPSTTLDSKFVLNGTKSLVLN